MKQYAVAMMPADGEQVTLLRVGVTDDLTLVPLDSGEILMEADLRGNTQRGRLGTWQDERPFMNGAQQDDVSLHLHRYYLKNTGGELSFVITEPPLITWFSVRASVSASLTIS